MTNSSYWKSIPEVVDWLSQNTTEPWSWKKVLVRFLSENPETVTVFIPAGSQLERIKDGVIDLVCFGYPVALQVVQVHQFIEHLLMGFDLESACARPLAMIGFNARFRAQVPIPATALRFNAQDIRGIQSPVGDSSFRELVNQIREQRHPQLAELSARVAGGSMALSKGKTVYRRAPASGTALTPLLWKILYDIYEEQVLNADLELSVALKPSNVMGVLRSMADQVPRIYPLLESVTGGIKYELESGTEQELYSEGLRNGIRRWKAANPEILASRSAA